MKTELLIGKDLLYPVTEEGIEWTTERRSTPGKLSFKILRNGSSSFSEGAPVRLKINDKNIFYGFVFSQKRNRDQIITINAYD